MDKDKLILSILGGALPVALPILINYLLKLFENKNNSIQSNRQLNDIEKRIEFIKTYFQAQKEFLSSEEADILKKELSNELRVIKEKSARLLFNYEKKLELDKLSLARKLFLLFKPLSFLGWIWHILFYINTLFIAVIFISYITDEEGNYSKTSLLNNVNDIENNMLTLVFVVVGLIFQRLALSDYNFQLLKEQQPVV